MGIAPFKETPICFCASQNYFDSENMSNEIPAPHPKSRSCNISASTKTLHQVCMGCIKNATLDGAKKTIQPHWPHGSNPFFICKNWDQGSRCFTISRVLKGLKAVSAHAIRSSKAAPGSQSSKVCWGGKSWWKISWKYYCHWSVCLSQSMDKIWLSCWDWNLMAMGHGL